LGTPHVEGVAVTEMGIVADVRNTAIVASAVATVVSNGLCLLPSGRLRLVLRLLGAFWLRLALCLLRALRLRSLGALWRCFLGMLGLCFLGVLGLRSLGALRLRFLGVLRLLLVLRCLGFSSSLFFLFLCECRKGGSEK